MSPMPRWCLQCGEVFTPRYAAQILCSYRCSGLHRRVSRPPKQCRECGQDFSPEQKHYYRQVYCSKRCSSKSLLRARWCDWDYTAKMIANRQRRVCDPNHLQKLGTSVRRALRLRHGAYQLMLQLWGREHTEALLADCKKHAWARYAEAYRIMNSMTPKQWVALLEDYQPPTAEGVRS